MAGWQFYCYWGNAWSNCQSSGNAANANAGPVNPTAQQPQTQAPPTGLRVAMQFAEGSALTGSLTRELEVTVR